MDIACCKGPLYKACGAVVESALMLTSPIRFRKLYFSSTLWERANLGVRVCCQEDSQKAHEAGVVAGSYVNQTNQTLEIVIYRW